VGSTRIIAETQSGHSTYFGFITDFDTMPFNPDPRTHVRGMKIKLAMGVHLVLAVEPGVIR